MVYVYGIAAALNENDLLRDLLFILDKPLQLIVGQLELSLFAQHYTYLLNTIKQSKKDCRPFQALQRARRALNQPGGSDYTTLKDLEEFKLSTFPSERALKKESARRL